MSCAKLGPPVESQQIWTFCFVRKCITERKRSIADRLYLPYKTSIIG